MPKIVWSFTFCQNAITLISDEYIQRRIEQQCNNTLNLIEIKKFTQLKNYDFLI